MRKYPLVIAALPAVFSTFFPQARQLLHEARKGLEMRDLAGRIEKLKVEFPGTLEAEAREHQSRLAAMTSERFWRGLFDRFDDARKYLLFKNLTAAISRALTRPSWRWDCAFRLWRTSAFANTR